MKSEPEGPVDRYKIIYVIFFWLGIGTLLPWNMFISVSESLSSQLKRERESDRGRTYINRTH